MDNNNYNHYPLVNNINRLFASSDIVPSLRQRDHLLMPREHRPPAIVDTTVARWYGRLLWLRERLKQRD